MSEPRIVGEFSDYAGLLAGLRTYVEQLNLAGDMVDTMCGMPRGYYQKIAGPRPVRRIGMQSLGDIFVGLGLRCILVADDEALKRINGSAKQRTKHNVRNGAVHVTLSRRFLKQIGRIGGKNSRKNLGKRQRRKLAQRAAIIRWNDVKAAVKTCE